MRSLEWSTNKGYLLNTKSLLETIGQHHMHSPTVFNFYDPLFVPMGPIAEAGLVSPEAELGTGPYVIGWLNLMSQIVRNGWPAYESGVTRYTPVDPTNSSAVVDELQLLLTGGRLSAESRAVLAEVGTRARSRTSTARRPGSGYRSSSKIR